ncbi:hypothetical protein BJ912DRAFT_192002 [Pholiota molesta]|nr:hypothetical protein BJ912DRAFT_192002 [Pholiota molesta]
MAETEDKPLFATFESLGELRSLQETLLDLGWEEGPQGEEKDEESQQFQKFALLLDGYQEQSYLLDPFLEDLVAPVVENLKEFARISVENPDLKYSPWRASTVSRILYRYIKFRGYKTISQ